MRKVELRVIEEHKYKIIKKLYDSNGNKKRAAAQLNCDIRTINRLLKKYRELGKNAFVHGNRGKKPTISFSEEVKQKITSLFINKYYDFNFKHFQEKLKNKEGINISYTALLNLLKKQNICSKKSHKRTKNKIKKLLESADKKENGGFTEKEFKRIEDLIVDFDKQHPRKPSAKYFGETVQLDASQEFWFGDKKTHLHIAKDEATGMIIGAYFDTQETLKGYYEVFAQILENYGIPAKFFTDRRTVFIYKKLNDLSIENDYTTQFAHACSQLGIEIKTSSVPQAKGKVERGFDTLQSRLIPELRIENIKELVLANEFIKKYIHELNKKFVPDFDFTRNVFEKQLKKEEINIFLSVLSKRKVDNGHSIKFKNKHFIPVNSKGEDIYLKPKLEVHVIESLDGTIYLNVENENYCLREIPKNYEVSKEFDLDHEVVKIKNSKKYIPPKDHPWRKTNLFYLTASKQAHRKDLIHEIY